jgi:hypothetical protein
MCAEVIDRRPFFNVGRNSAHSYEFGNRPSDVKDF